jgi:YVTN family beta-propeller protein
MLLIFSNTVSVIDESSNGADKVIANIRVGKSPAGIAINPITNMIYVTNQGFNNISVINGKTNRVINNFAAGISPTGIAINPKHNVIYVANAVSGTVDVTL